MEFSKYECLEGDVFYQDRTCVLEDMDYDYDHSVICKAVEEKIPKECYAVIGFTGKVPAHSDIMKLYIRYKPKPEKIPQKLIDEFCNKFIEIFPKSEYYPEPMCIYMKVPTDTVKIS